MALRAIADQGKGVILEVLLQAVSWPVFALVDRLLGASEVNGLDPTD